MDINLNADLGEGYGAWRMGDDRGLLQVVGSANVACGFHAGDPLVMLNTVRAARESGASIGAHPSFADLQGFGRRPMRLSPAELRGVVLYQVGALQAMARAEGVAVTHVKPHGAMNNMACDDAAMAATIAEAVRDLDPRLILLAPALSLLAAAGRAAGLRVADEIYADRAYTEDAKLMPRHLPGAVLHDSAQSVAHVLAMLRQGGIVTAQGRVLPCAIHSVCVHGDDPQAVATAAAVRDALRAAGCTLRTLPELPVLRAAAHA